MNIKKLLGYALGPIGSAAASAISLPLISWYFPADDIGRIVLLQTVSGLILIVLGLGLDQSYIREYHAAPDKSVLLNTVSLLPLLLSAACIAGILLAAPAMPSEMILELKQADLGVLCVVFMAALVPARFLSVVLRMQERAYAFSFSQLMPKLLILVLVAGYMLTGAANSTFNLVAAYAAAQWLALAVLSVQTRRDAARAWKAHTDPALLKETLKYGVPLVLGGLAYWGLTSVDRLMLKQYGSLAELGIYSMAVSFGAAALIFQSIFSTIWAPMVFRWVNENENLDRIAKIVPPMLAAAAAVLCLAGIFSPLIPLILPSKYAAVQFILLSSILFPLLYTMTEVTGIGINVSRKTWLVTVISVIALAANFALCRLLVPAFGAKGAAASMAVSFWLYFALKTEASVLLWQKLPRTKIYGTTLICLFSCLAYTFWGSRGNYPLFAASWAAALAGIGFAYRTQLVLLAERIAGRLKKAA